MRKNCISQKTKFLPKKSKLSNQKIKFPFKFFETKQFKNDEFSQIRHFIKIEKRSFLKLKSYQQDFLQINWSKRYVFFFGLSIPRPRGHSLNQGYYYLLYYDCFCSVDKNHHLHRRWINPFPQLLAYHPCKINSYVN